MQTRMAGPDDADAIARFVVVNWRDAYEGVVASEFLQGPAADDREDRWRGRVGSGRRKVAIAVPRAGPGCGVLPFPSDEVASSPEPAGIVGLVAWKAHLRLPPEAPPLELASLYVKRGWWGSGLGGWLLEFALRGESAHLWVFEENRRARRFYEKHGFRPDGRRQLDGRTGVWEYRYVRDRAARELVI